MREASGEYVRYLEEKGLLVEEEVLIVGCGSLKMKSWEATPPVALYLGRPAPVALYLGRPPGGFVCWIRRLATV